MIIIIIIIFLITRGCEQFHLQILELNQLTGYATLPHTSYIIRKHQVKDINKLYLVPSSTTLWVRLA